MSRVEGRGFHVAQGVYLFVEGRGFHVEGEGTMSRVEGNRNRTRYLSALNYEFLVQPTRMEGKNSYCVVKCVINGTMQSLESIFLMQSY